MANKDSYLESRILAADPVELICILYEHCLDSVGEARRRMAAGHIAERSRAIQKAMDILRELTASLDWERGGTLSPRFSELYIYLQELLLEANLRAQDALLREAETLLGNLYAGWSGAREGQRSTIHTKVADREAQPRLSPIATRFGMMSDIAAASQGWSA